MTDAQGTTDDAASFKAAWTDFIIANPRILTMPAPDRAMLRRGFVYGWTARENAND